MQTPVEQEETEFGRKQKNYSRCRATLQEMRSRAGWMVWLWRRVSSFIFVTVSLSSSENRFRFSKIRAERLPTYEHGANSLRNPEAFHLNFIFHPSVFCNHLSFQRVRQGQRRGEETERSSCSHADPTDQGPYNPQPAFFSAIKKPFNPKYDHLLNISK